MICQNLGRSSSALLRNGMPKMPFQILQTEKPSWKNFYITITEQRKSCNQKELLQKRYEMISTSRRRQSRSIYASEMALKFFSRANLDKHLPLKRSKYHQSPAMIETAQIFKFPLT